MAYTGSDHLPPFLQLATEKVPFPELSMSHVYGAVLKKKRPLKPARFKAPGITPRVWKLAKKCWHQKPEKRPEANAVLQDLETLLQSNVCTRRTCA